MGGSLHIFSIMGLTRGALLGRQKSDAWKVMLYELGVAGRGLKGVGVAWRGVAGRCGAACAWLQGRQAAGERGGARKLADNNWGAGPRNAAALGHR